MVTHKELLTTDLILYELAALRVNLAKRGGDNHNENRDKARGAVANSIEHTTELVAQNVDYNAHKDWKRVRGQFDGEFQLSSALRSFAPQDDAARRRDVLEKLKPFATGRGQSDLRDVTLKKAEEKLAESKPLIGKPVLDYLRQRELGRASGGAANQVVRGPEYTAQEVRPIGEHTTRYAIDGLNRFRKDASLQIFELSNKIANLPLSREQLEGKIARYEDKVLRQPSDPALRKILEEQARSANPTRDRAIQGSPQESPQEPPQQRRRLNAPEDQSVALDTRARDSERVR